MRHPPESGLPFNACPVAHREDAERVLRDPAAFSSAGMGDGGIRVVRPGEGPPLPPEHTLLGSDPPLHAALRRPLDRFLGARFRTLEARGRVALDEVLRRAGPRGSFELVGEVCRPVVAAALGEALGVPPGEVEAWLRALAALSGAGPGEEGADGVEPMLERLRVEVLGPPRARGALPSELAAAARRGELSAAQALNLCVLLLQGAADTTTLLTGNALLALLADPALVRAVRAEPRLVPRAVDESLRRDPPLRLVFRRARRDTELAGTRISAGALLAVRLDEAGGGAELHPDPDCFRLDRPRAPPLAFGAGPHRCPGAPLARSLACAVLEGLLALHGLRVDEVEEVCSPVLRGPRRVQLSFRPWAPSP